MKTINIRYNEKGITRLKKIEKNRTDLRVANAYSESRVKFPKEIAEGVDLSILEDDILKKEMEDGVLEYIKGDTVIVDLGVTIDIPEGYEAVVAPRTSTFKNTGLVLITDDILNPEFYATRNGKIEFDQKIGQLKIEQCEDRYKFKEVENLDCTKEPEIKKTKIRYINKNVPRLKNITTKSDWVDVYVSKVKVNEEFIDWDDNGNIYYNQFDTVHVYLGFALKLDYNEEADIRPRSSTFKNTGFLETNSAGVIDSGYCGNNDEWQQEFFATRDGVISKYQRLGQFRIQEKQKPREFISVTDLHSKNRGGFGSTGKF